MRRCSLPGWSIAAALLISCAGLAGCGKTALEHDDVLAFIDAVDQAARDGDWSDMCRMRGQEFTLRYELDSEHPRNRAAGRMDRKSFCSYVVSFARIDRYELYRHSIDIDIAADRLTATVVAEYEERLPFFDPSVTRLTPGEFDDFEIVTTTDETVVGIEDGDIVILSTTSESWQEIVPKTQMEVKSR